jgi:hypothetical protein
MSVVEFPPKVECECCHTPMRPATALEIQADSIDPRYSHVARIAAQGEREFDIQDEDPLANADGLVERPSWLFRCDMCGMRLLWNRLEEP